MVHRLERTTFETPRASEYFTADELRKQTTQPPEKFGSVVIKELIDNALDACEGAGVVPEVTIRTVEGAVKGHVRITVSDNGPGIPPEVVGKMLNFETRTSDKAAYRSPTRGAQGNALKTVVGIPHALGSSEPVVIEARGIRHVIEPMVDPAGNVRVAHEMQNSEGSAGTRVTVTLPQRFELKPVECKPNYWAAAVSLFNPHAFVKLERFSESNNHMVYASPIRSSFTNRPRRASRSTSPTTTEAPIGTGRRPWRSLSARTSGRCGAARPRTFP